MSGAWRRRVRSLLPAGVRAWVRRLFGWRWFRGDYASWAVARAVSAGYEDPAGLARVIHAARQVRADHAAWDRDGVTFKEPDFHEPLVKALQRVQSARVAPLHVIDFGGGLGSTWWQHRTRLVGWVAQWRVVEQPALVTAGRGEFATAPVSFHDSLAEACTAGPPDAILLSSVLPYVEEPHALLAAVAARRIPHVILDRTPFTDAARDRLVVQFTPPVLGGGSYPCWLFARAGLFATLGPDYVLLDEWEVAFDRLSAAVTHRGMHFALRAEIRSQSVTLAC